MPQTLLPFQYQSDAHTGCTSLAGLPLFIDMAKVSGLCDAITNALNLKQRGWSDQQVILSLILLNISGGDCVDDIDRLEEDDGLRQLMLRLETSGMKRQARRAYERRFRKSKRRAFPSPTVIRHYLNKFHSADEENKRVAGQAFIPANLANLSALKTINSVLINFMQHHHTQAVATLDQDATLVETHKASALFCYKKYKAYQPLNTYWAEQQLVLHSEFRDGNVNAGYQQLRVLEESLTALPETVKQVRLRSDSAGYQATLLSYCAQGQHPRFGVIEFAISAKVSSGFKAAVKALTEADWQAIYTPLPNGDRLETNQQWAEVCFVPDWACRKKSAPTYRYIAVREKLIKKPTTSTDKALPFPTLTLQAIDYKLFGIVTNRTIDGHALIHWHRERCGQSEKIHSVQKSDLAGGQLPSKLFGANAAWWQIMILSLNLTELMRRLALPNRLSSKRLKGLRFNLITIAGHVVSHARGLFIKLSGGKDRLTLVQGIRDRLVQLALPTRKRQRA